MLRRLSLTILFALLLIFGQQLAVVHGYVHNNDWQQASSDEEKSSSHSELCGKCVSLAGLGAAIGSGSLNFQIVAGQFELFAALIQAVVTPRFYSYHSRAPPSLNSL